MTAPIEFFNYCPRCAAQLPRRERPNRIRCERCGFTYYFNPVVSAAAFVQDHDGRVLLLRRAKEPAQGRLTLPGGFVDFGETAEEALRRETLEEVGIALAHATYLCSQVNSYTYLDVTYSVLDLFFTARPASLDARPLDGATSVSWMAPHAVPINEIAFPSVRTAWETFLRTRGEAR
ncbi:MAG: NUDIX domain-containing protein [Verrucomicrobia bacterium]|nr:NUDIX domain-containing protein [Verrucomicrobiota bacterium]